MSKTNLLNTRTANFLELVGNGRIYRVPPFQRDYSWEEEQWEDLWNDLEEMHERLDERHYMGALVVEGKTVLETLNARRLELSSTDLLKNYLFSRLKVTADLEALPRRWQALLATIRQERFPEFLRYHLLCEQPKVRTERLFKLVRDRRPHGAGCVYTHGGARTACRALLGSL